MAVPGGIKNRKLINKMPLIPKKLSRNPWSKILISSQSSDISPIGMLVDWDLTSDFSNTRQPKTKGFLMITWLRGSTEYEQKLELVVIASDSYKQVGYFRIVEGNGLTNASKDWLKIDKLSELRGNQSPNTLYTRQQQFGRHSDKKILRAFEGQPRSDEFKNFAGFDFYTYNSPAFYMVMGNMRNRNDKSNIASTIRNNKAYVMQNCQKSTTEAWCDG